MEAVDPAASMTTVIDGRTGIIGAYHPGDAFAPGEIVHAVHRGFVEIDNHGTREIVPVGATPAPAPPVPERPAPSGGKADTRDDLVDDAQSAITCSGSACTVDRAFVERLLADPTQLLGQVAAAPATTADGSPGFRLRGKSGGGLLSLLGLRNGDVVVEVDGRPATLDNLASLYGALRRSRQLTVTVERAGSRLERSIEVLG
jgi:general secretion pathway protein C